MVPGAAILYWQKMHNDKRYKHNRWHWLHSSDPNNYRPCEENTPHS